MPPLLEEESAGDAGGGIAALCTDWPVSPLSPMLAIHAALTRRTWAEDVPDQRLSLADVFSAYTAGGARADHREAQLGRLESGLAADLILLDGDPRALMSSPYACSVALTLCAGRAVHDTLSG